MKFLTLLITLSVAAAAADVPWQARLKYIEACTCNLFCPCFFNKQAAHKHSGAAMCNFNMGTVVEKGKYGDVDLTGMKF